VFAFKIIFSIILRLKIKTPPRRRVANLFEPLQQGGVLHRASGKQVPERKARSQPYDPNTHSNRMLAQINIAITNIAGA
jgi:hypothetical protein